MSSIRHHFLIICFIFIYLFLTFFTYKDFGITWDEQDFYVAGKDLYVHLVGKDSPSVTHLIIKTHGAEIKAVYNYMYSAFYFF